MHNNLGELINSLRLSNGISIDELARKMGVSAETINLWEINHGMPDDIELRRLSEIFKQYDSENTKYFNNNANDKIRDKSLLNRFVRLAGGDSAQIKFLSLFKDTFKKHNKGEFNDVKSIEDFDINNFTKPYMYFRVFIVLALCFIISLFIHIPYIVLFFGTIFIPITFFMFIWELNVFKNLTLKKCVWILSIGGLMSIIAALIAYEFAYITYNINLVTALTIGIIEEAAKFIVSYYFIKKLKIKTILPAMVIGASVGVGFSIIESFSYAYNALRLGGYNNMLRLILLRGFLSIGAHPAWSAITAAAFIKVANKYSYSFSSFFTKDYLRVFSIPVLLHTFWNYFARIPILAVIIVIGLTLLAAIINIGLKEASRISKSMYYTDNNTFYN